MTFSQTHLSYKFKLEQRPEGGWVATSDDPPCTLEGATREEVEQKMREKIAERVTPEFAKQIKLAIPGVKVNSNIKITLRPGSSDRMTITENGKVLDSGPKAEAVISPKLLVLLGAAIAIALLLWRIATRH